MSWNEPNPLLSDEHQLVLLDVAGRSIAEGLDSGLPLKIVPEDFPHQLRARLATFVTLKTKGNLRGCMGSLVAKEPLVVNVANNAYSAAFRDPRFPPLTRPEAALLSIHVSILSDPEPMAVASEGELLQRVRPGIDGLILYEGERRGTLLPAVWTSVPDPGEFLAHLKQKAGLAADYWSETIRIERYTAVSVGGP